VTKKEEVVELVPMTFRYEDRDVERYVSRRDGVLPRVVEVHDLTIRQPGDASSVTWWLLDEYEGEDDAYYPVPHPAQLFVRDEET